MRILFILLLIISYTLLFLAACEPLVNTFDDTEDAVMYVSKAKSSRPSNPDTIKAMTWNIRFGAGRLAWFGDCCGDRVILTDREVKLNLKSIAEKIVDIDPDIILLQEVDRCSKRTGYVDQIRWLLENTELNYAVYASNWDAQFIPSDGLGRMDMGNVIMSRWEITEAKRLQLPLRGDQDGLTRYFYLRRNILTAKIAIPQLDDFCVVNVHTSAFSTDNTKRNQIDRFKALLDEIDDSGGLFIAGGDLNELPPGSKITDFCLKDMCPGESYHNPGDNPLHKEGSNFTQEQDWLTSLYDSFQSALDLDDYQINNTSYFTHSVGTDTIWDRKLDYLFTNGNWLPDLSITHLEARHLSDHAPVMASFVIP